MKKIVPKVLISFLSTLIAFSALSVSPLFAGQYGHTYEFQRPKIKHLPNGLQIVEMEGTWQKDAVPGKPILPVKTANIFVPKNEEVVSTHINRSPLKPIKGFYKIQHATRPYPLSHKGTISMNRPDLVVYERDADYPRETHVKKAAQYLCGARIVKVDLMPIVYNPVQGQLRYCEQIVVTIVTKPQKAVIKTMPFRKLFHDTQRIVDSVDNKQEFVSFSQAEGGQEFVTSRQYLVITTQALTTTFQTLTGYRETAAGGGFNTHIATIEDIESNYSGVDRAEKVRNYIIDSYTNYGTEYVVLGGDCDGAPQNQAIPTRGAYAVVGDTTDTYIPSDLYFGCLDGSWNNDGDSLWGESNDGEGGGDIDWYSEVYVGRIPADNSSEALYHINKIIAFETSTTSPYKTLLVGEKLNSDPLTWGGDRMDWVYQYMDAMPKTELYDRDWAGNSWPKSQALTYINSEEHHWINHLGHSSVTYNMKMYNSDVFSMTNNEYLFVYTQGCYSGSIDNRKSAGSYGSDCFGEEITNAYEDNGAFAYIGNSRYGWYNPGSYVQGASNRAHKEFVEAVFTDNHVRIGKVNQISKTGLDFTQGVYRWIAFETNLLGDPVTRINTDCDKTALLVTAMNPGQGFVANKGEPVLVKTTVKNQCYELILNADVTAGFDNGDSALTLYDDGNHDDDNDGDGIYANTWTPQSTQDPTVITISASKSGYTGDSEEVFGQVCVLLDYAIDDTVQFNFEDISASGTDLGLSDDSWAWFSIPFTFSFYGKDYNAISVSSNGTLYFDNSFMTWDNACIPGQNDTNISTFIAPFWDDLNPEGGGAVYYQIKGTAPNRRLIVQWHDVPHWYNMGAVTFQAVLYEGTNKIIVQYQDVDFGDPQYDYGASATVGLQQNIEHGNQYSCNSQAMSDGLAVLFKPLADDAPGDELAVDFGSAYGVWHWNGSAWIKISSLDAEGLQDFAGNLAADFGPSYGLWKYDGAWTKISALDAEIMKDYGPADLAADFGSTYGLWLYDGSWTKISSLDTEILEDFDGGLAADFGFTYGLFKYDGSWTKISALDAELLESFYGDLAADFGPTYGLWKYDGSWTRISSLDAQILDSFDSGLAADFGSTYGLWIYDGTWTKISALDAEDMEGAGQHLFVDFGPVYGLWKYDGATWTKISALDAEGLQTFAGGLAADFGPTYGLWKYDGAWTKISALDAEEMVDVDIY
jgi:Peptidase family C25/Propeptide_C25